MDEQELRDLCRQHSPLAVRTFAEAAAAKSGVATEASQQLVNRGFAKPDEDVGTVLRR